MTRWSLTYVLAALLFAGTDGVTAQDRDEEAPAIEARVWLDRGQDPILNRGDRVRVYYRSSEPAYVALFHIDTDGVVKLLHPRSPEEPSRIEEARDYQLVFPRTPFWYVDEDEGQGYFFVLASPDPFEFDAFHYRGHEQTWDLGEVGRTAYEDPYLAMDEYVAALLPDWERVGYALDFLTYDVGGAHEYPRFLCYQCHGFRAYATWNPYAYACTDFRVVIWDDPWFYPAYRHGPTRVVYSSAPRGRPRFDFKERVAGEGWSPLTRTRQAPTRGPIGLREPSVAAPARGGLVPLGRPSRPGAANPVNVRPRARPSGVHPDGRGPGPVRPSEPVQGPGVDRPRPPSGRPILLRRPPRSDPNGPTRGVGPPLRPPTGAATSGGGRGAPTQRPAAGSPGARPSDTARPRQGGANRPPKSGSSKGTVKRPGTGRPSRPGGGSTPV